MKILLLGKNGQVGWELNRSLQPLGEIIALDIEDVDFSDPEGIRQVVQEIKPDLICNAVAYTAVDKAESEEDLVMKINGVAPGVLAEEALNLNALLVHYSTDYVFDGSKKTPYVEEDKPAPINAYGRTKLAGEQAVQASGCDYLILRTSWVYAARGHNFLLTILRLAREREDLSIVADQIGSPTTAAIIAKTTAKCIKQSMAKRANGDFKSDLYHLTTDGQTSWHGFAEEIVKEAKNNSIDQFAVKRIQGIPTADYPTPAERPKYSRLALNKLQSEFHIEMPSWVDALHTCLLELKQKTQ